MPWCRYSSSRTEVGDLGSAVVTIQSDAPWDMLEGFNPERILHNLLPGDLAVGREGS